MKISIEEFIYPRISNINRLNKLSNNEDEQADEEGYFLILLDLVILMMRLCSTESKKVKK